MSTPWTKIGLFISNHNEEAFLAIQDLIFTGKGRLGDQTYEYSQSVSVGYCDTTSFLYLVPPRRQVEYKPHSRNPFHNLTIYIDGFERVENQSEGSGGSSRDLDQQTSQGSSPISSALGSSSLGGQGGISRLSEQQLGPTTFSIPDYDVNITAIGYFMLEDGSLIASFQKTFSFSTISSLDF